MRIGISAIHVRPGKCGSHQPYLVNLVHAISELDTPHEFFLFVTPANQHLFDRSRSRMEFVVYPGVTEEVLPRILFEQIALPIDVLRRKIDVMHYPGNTVSFLARRSDAVTVHFDSVTQRTSLTSARSLYYDAVSRINQKAGRIIAPSQVYADELVAMFGYRPERVSAVHHGVSPIFRDVPADEAQAACKQYGIEPGYILTVTHTRPHKNIPNLLRAYHLLRERDHLENQLVMVGYVDEAALMQMISEISDDPRRLRSAIKVIPFLPHELLPPIYASAAAFVFFSKVETFGMPLVEAMACGLPIVASDIPIHREIVQNAGLLIPPDAPESLADALQKILSDPVYRDLLAHAALNCSEQYSWKKTARATLQVYEDCWSSARKN